MVMFWQIMESEFGGDPAGGADWMQWVRLAGSALAELMQVYLNKYRGVCSFFGMVTGFRFFYETVMTCRQPGSDPDYLVSWNGNPSVLIELITFRDRRYHTR